jgi:hypothetical protein
VQHEPPPHPGQSHALQQLVSAAQVQVAQAQASPQQPQATLASTLGDEAAQAPARAVTANAATAPSNRRRIMSISSI